MFMLLTSFLIPSLLRVANDENFKFQDVHVCVELTRCIAFDNIFPELSKVPFKFIYSESLAGKYFFQNIMKRKSKALQSRFSISKSIRFCAMNEFQPTYRFRELACQR